MSEIINNYIVKSMVFIDLVDAEMVFQILHVDLKSNMLINRK